MMASNTSACEAMHGRGRPAGTIAPPSAHRNRSTACSPGRHGSTQRVPSRCASSGISVQVVALTGAWPVGRRRRSPPNLRGRL